MEIITLEAYITASGKYPERLKHPALTPALIENAKMLLTKVNAFLVDVGIKSAVVSSGFRPPEVNASTPGSAKASLHMTCQAIDIADKNGELDELVDESDKLLKKYGLWQESPAHTPSWCHLDMKNRGVRPKNVFIP